MSSIDRVSKRCCTVAIEWCLIGQQHNFLHHCIDSIGAEWQERFYHCICSRCKCQARLDNSIDLRPSVHLVYYCSICNCDVYTLIYRFQSNMCWYFLHSWLYWMDQESKSTLNSRFHCRRSILYSLLLNHTGGVHNVYTYSIAVVLQNNKQKMTSLGRAQNWQYITKIISMTLPWFMIASVMEIIKMKKQEIVQLNCIVNINETNLFKRYFSNNSVTFLWGKYMFF